MGMCLASGPHSQASPIEEDLFPTPVISCSRIPCWVTAEEEWLGVSDAVGKGGPHAGGSCSATCCSLGLCGPWLRKG